MEPHGGLPQTRSSETNGTAAQIAVSAHEEKITNGTTAPTDPHATRGARVEREAFSWLFYYQFEELLVAVSLLQAYRTFLKESGQ